MLEVVPWSSHYCTSACSCVCLGWSSSLVQSPQARLSTRTAAAITSTSHNAHTQTFERFLPINEKILLFPSSYKPNLLFTRNFPHHCVVDTRLLAIANCVLNIYGWCFGANDAWGAEITPIVCTSVSENKRSPPPPHTHMPFINIISQENSRTTWLTPSSNCHFERGAGVQVVSPGCAQYRATQQMMLTKQRRNSEATFWDTV